MHYAHTEEFSVGGVGEKARIRFRAAFYGKKPE
jgi:hypothetical protein